MMPKPRLYLETTIPSYLANRPSRDLIIAGHQQVTHIWWRTRRQEFELVGSQIVIDEASAGDPEAAKERLLFLEEIPLLETSHAVDTLADAILDCGLIPQRASRDAAHIAICAVHGVEFLLTWNCTHLANAYVIREVSEICAIGGFKCPTICTPELLMTRP